MAPAAAPLRWAATGGGVRRLVEVRRTISSPARTKPRPLSAQQSAGPDSAGGRVVGGARGGAARSRGRASCCGSAMAEIQGAGTAVLAAISGAGGTVTAGKDDGGEPGRRQGRGGRHVEWGGGEWAGGGVAGAARGGMMMVGLVAAHVEDAEERGCV